MASVVKKEIDDRIPSLIFLTSYRAMNRPIARSNIGFGTCLEEKLHSHLISMTDRPAKKLAQVILIHGPDNIGIL